MDLVKWNANIEKLTQDEKHVLINKGTQRAFVGEYTEESRDGVYRCKLCKAPLYTSKDKFSSHCGWPSFDDAIKGAIKSIPDVDGRRTEIVCANCGAHMGHIFSGEGYTPKNERHCVNSISLEFIVKAKLSKAYFAGGCFWGVEYYLEKLPGVKEVTSGFMGGELKNPSYEDVIYKKTGHLEAVEVIYDNTKISYKELAKAFFEIHDPTQANGQGPDIGEQYLSAVFVSSKEEREIILELISLLKAKKYAVVTKILDKKEFFAAEDYHQNYYNKKGSKPYCHSYTKRF